MKTASARRSTCVKVRTVCVQCMKAPYFRLAHVNSLMQREAMISTTMIYKRAHLCSSLVGVYSLRNVVVGGTRAVRLPHCDGRDLNPANSAAHRSVRAGSIGTVGKMMRVAPEQGTIL